MSTNIRFQVLSTFKKLHRTRQRVFDGDTFALNCSRQEINKRFKDNKNESNEDEIKKMINFANEVEHELSANVIQAREKSEGIYELRLRPETTRFDNVMFNPNADIKPRPSKKKKCCQEEQLSPSQSNKT